jgi:YidC/Oxa1 family membrane protein insertase
MRLYKENNPNPVSSCLPLLIQLPILWAVFEVFRDGFKPESLSGLYSFIAKPETINHFFLSIHWLDLSKPNIFLSILAAAAQYWQGSMLAISRPSTATPGSKNESMQATINKQMLYMMPVITLVFGLTLPSGLMLYWFVSTVLMGLQQWLQFNKSRT